MPDATFSRISDVERQIAEARADQLAADLAGDTVRVGECTARMNRLIDYYSALAAGLVTMSKI